MRRISSAPPVAWVSYDSAINIDIHKYFANERSESDDDADADERMTFEANQTGQRHGEYLIELPDGRE